MKINGFQGAWLAVCYLPAMLFAAQPNLILAKEFKGQNVRGWAMSEKLDGVRGFWDGKRLISRQGYAFQAPAEFTRAFPPFPLDGELYSKRGQFERISSIVRSNKSDWKQLKLHVFDVPKAKGNLYQRLAVAQDWVKRHPDAPIVIIKQIPVKDMHQVNDFLKRVVDGGGEGVMLRNPNLNYQAGRSSGLLKLKPVYDDECTVTRHYPGKGRYEGMLGAVGCRNRYGEFRIGSGFKKHDRMHPPAVGSVITYRYRGFTRKGTPKFATFYRVRTDR